MGEEKKAKIGPGKKIRIMYTITSAGKMIETTEGKPPLYYTQGTPSILPALQERLEGLAEGDEAEFDLSVEEAYGPFRPEAVVEVSKNEMPDKPLRVGMILQENLPDGKFRVGRVQEIREKTVVMNFNHPMAGKALRYQVRVISVME